MTRGCIVLDPGHGEKSNPHSTAPGCCDGYYEGMQNFVLACCLKDVLTSYGFSVLVTREHPADNPTLEERGSLAGRSEAILFLSLHSNAPGAAIPPDRYHEVRGVEVYYSLSDEEGNLPLARALCETVSRVMRTPDRGVKTRTYPGRPGIDYYGVLRHSAASGCCRALLVEHGFHTNPEDSMFLRDPDCLMRLAKAEADVIDRFFTEKGR